jgi:hypothetical protein
MATMKRHSCGDDEAAPTRGLIGDLAALHGALPALAAAAAPEDRARVLAAMRELVEGRRAPRAPSPCADEAAPACPAVRERALRLLVAFEAKAAALLAAFEGAAAARPARGGRARTGAPPRRFGRMSQGGRRHGAAADEA